MIIIAGATGEVGKSLVKLCEANQTPYIGICRTSKHRLSKNFKHGKIISLDLSRQGTFNELQEEIEKRKPKWLSWVHAVGTFSDYKKFADHSPQDIDTIMSGNFGTFTFALQFWLKQVYALNMGNFVCFSSLAAPEAYPFLSLFSASKMALESLMASVSNEIMAENITVNCLRLSTIDTPIERKMKPDGDFKHWLKPKEVAEHSFQMAVNFNVPRPRGALIPLYKPSSTYFGESPIRRYGKLPKGVVN